MALRLGAAVVQKLNRFWADEILAKGEDYIFEFQSEKKIAKYQGVVDGVITFSPSRLEFDASYHTNYPEVRIHHRGVHIMTISQHLEVSPNTTLNCPTWITLNP